MIQKYKVLQKQHKKDSAPSSTNTLASSTSIAATGNVVTMTSTDGAVASDSSSAVGLTQPKTSLSATATLPSSVEHSQLSAISMERSQLSTFEYSQFSPLPGMTQTESNAQPLGMTPSINSQISVPSASQSYYTSSVCFSPITSITSHIPIPATPPLTIQDPVPFTTSSITLTSQVPVSSTISQIPLPSTMGYNSTPLSPGCSSVVSSSSASSKTRSSSTSTTISSTDTDSEVRSSSDEGHSAVEIMAEQVVQSQSERRETEALTSCLYGVAICAIKFPAYFKPLFRLASALHQMKLSQVNITNACMNKSKFIYYRKQRPSCWAHCLNVSPQYRRSWCLYLL